MKTYKITDASSKKNIGKLMYINGNEIKIGRTLFNEADNDDLKDALEDKKYLRLWKKDNPSSTGSYIFKYELYEH